MTDTHQSNSEHNTACANHDLHSRNQQLRHENKAYRKALNRAKNHAESPAVKNIIDDVLCDPDL